MLEAVKQNGYSLEYVIPALKEARVFMFEAVRQNEYALKQVASDLKADHEFRLAAVGQHGRSLDNAAEDHANCLKPIQAAMKDDLPKPGISTGHVACTWATHSRNISNSTILIT